MCSKKSACCSLSIPQHTFLKSMNTFFCGSLIVSLRHNFHKLVPESLSPVCFLNVPTLPDPDCSQSDPAQVHSDDKCRVYSLIKVSQGEFHTVWSPQSVFLVQAGEICGLAQDADERCMGPGRHDEATRAHGAKPSLSLDEELELTTSPVTKISRGRI